MAQRSKSLGRQMLKTLDDLTDLMAATTDPDRTKELMSQYLKLRAELGELIDKNLDQASREYLAARKGLRDASAQIRLAIKGMESVAHAIGTVAKVVELVAKVG